MVSQAIQEGLIARIQNYVANDLNSKTPPSSDDAKTPPSSDDAKVRPENVYVLRFTRVLNSWEAVATAHLYPEIYYEIIHDGGSKKTIVNVLQKRRTQPAIL